jgi:hypothetical protein
MIQVFHVFLLTLSTPPGEPNLIFRRVTDAESWTPPGQIGLSSGMRYSRHA